MDAFRDHLHRHIRRLSEVSRPEVRDSIIGVGRAIEQLAAHIDDQQRELGAALLAQGNARQRAIYDAWRLLAQGLYLDLEASEARLAAQIEAHRRESHIERSELRQLIEQFMVQER